MKRISVIYKILIIIAAALGILLQAGIAEGTFDIGSFRYFTTLSNLAVLVYYICHLAGTTNGKTRPGLRKWKFMITLSILLTGVVAHFMLRGLFADMNAAQKLGLTFLHYVVPIAVLVDWLIFDAKGHTAKYMPLFAALFPIIYAAATMVLVHYLTQKFDYPYPFLNVITFGWKQVIINIIIIAAAYLAVGYIGVGMDHLLRGRHKK